MSDYQLSKIYAEAMDNVVDYPVASGYSYVIPPTYYKYYWS